MLPRADRLSRLLVPTLKEAPPDVRGVAWALLARAGMLRRSRGARDTWLTAGLRVWDRVASIAREELGEVDGAQEVGAFGSALFEILRRDVRSPKQLPLALYTVHGDVQVVVAGEAPIAEAFARVAARAGVTATPIDGGGLVVAGDGDDEWLACGACGYSATFAAAATAAAPPAVGAVEPLRELATPGVKSIAELSRFLGGAADVTHFVKTLIYVAEDNVPLMALVRGDRDVDEAKLARAAGLRLVRLASDAVVREVTGADVGFAGAQGRSVSVYADAEVAAIASGVTGANKTDAHVIGFNLGRDVPGAHVVELRSAAAGDGCGRCGRGSFATVSGLLVAESDATVGRLSLDALVVACVAQHHDADGIVWPAALAPWQVVVVALGEGEVAVAAAELADALAARGVATLLDDRDERAGAKFKDADLMGVPTRLTVGKRGLAEGAVERKRRGEKEAHMVPMQRIVDEEVAHVRT
jgi:prolyl-tRNA synthetase